MAYPPVDRNRYSVCKPPHWMLVHWILNPGLAINELILGQRIPAVTWIERDQTKPLVQRQWIPCPHCGELSHGMLYSEVMFKAWAGLACAQCGEKLPTLKNAVTWIVLMITWPLWKPIERRYGPRMLARQFEILNQADAAAAGASEPPSALRIGFAFGLWMAPVFFAIHWFQSGEPLAAAISGLVTAAIAGLMFGVAMKVFMSWRGSGPKASA